MKIILMAGTELAERENPQRTFTVNIFLQYNSAESLDHA